MTGLVTGWKERKRKSFLASQMQDLHTFKMYKKTRGRIRSSSRLNPKRHGEAKEPGKWESNETLTTGATTAHSALEGKQTGGDLATQDLDHKGSAETHASQRIKDAGQSKQRHERPFKRSPKLNDQN